MGTLFTIYKHFWGFVKCIFTILLPIQHENHFLYTFQSTLTSQSSSLSWYLFGRLLH